MASYDPSLNFTLEAMLARKLRGEASQLRREADETETWALAHLAERSALNSAAISRRVYVMEELAQQARSLAHLKRELAYVLDGEHPPADIELHTAPPEVSGNLDPLTLGVLAGAYHNRARVWQLRADLMLTAAREEQRPLNRVEAVQEELMRQQAEALTTHARLCADGATQLETLHRSMN